MAVLLVLLALAAGLPGEALVVDVRPDQGALSVGLHLQAPLPAPFVEALPSGAQVRLQYRLQVRSHRRLWWDRRVWRGNVSSVAAFDPVTGRYRCDLTLDDVVVSSREVETADEAQAWLTDPPAVRLVLPQIDRAPRLYVRARAVFSSSTTWLIFPSVEGTDWIEVELDASQ